MMHLVHVWGYKKKRDGPVNPFGKANVGMGESSEYHSKRLKYHNRVHRSPGKKDRNKEKNTSQHAFDGMMAQASGYIYVIVGVVYGVKSPEQRCFMLRPVHEPATKEIEENKGNNDGSQCTGIRPVDHSKSIAFTPVRDQNNDKSKKSMYNKVNDREAEINRGMFPFVLFIVEPDQGYRTFQDPKEE